MLETLEREMTEAAAVLDVLQIPEGRLEWPDWHRLTLAERIHVLYDRMLHHLHHAQTASAEEQRTTLTPPITTGQNEGLAIVNDERRSPEARLERLRQRLEFARQFTSHLPSGVRAELDADPAVQAVLADIAAGRDSVTAARFLLDDELQQLRQGDAHE